MRRTDNEKRKSLQGNIERSSKSFKNARESSVNIISDNCKFIFSEIKNSDKNFFEQNEIRKIDNDKKIPKSLTDAIVQLERMYGNLYDVNLCIYKAESHSTIVEIQYFPRSLHDLEYQKIPATQEVMLHCKVAVPAYASENKEKFDINWQLGTLNHKWKMFWWQRKTKKYLESRGVKL